MTRVWEPGWQDLSNWHLTSKGPGFGGGVSWAVLGYQRPGSCHCSYSEGTKAGMVLLAGRVPGAVEGVEFGGK